MSDQQFNERSLTRDPLGALPQAEAERCDELSVTDDEFVLRLSAAEKDLVDAYVRGEMTGTTLQEFESHYLVSSVRREKVAFARAFQDSLKRLSTTAAKDATDTSAKRGWFAAFGEFIALRPASAWGLAAVVLAMFIGGSWFALENISLRQRMSQADTTKAELQRREQALQKELEEQRAANSRAEQELAQVRAERERLDKELNAGRNPKSTNQPSPMPEETSIFSFVLSPLLRGANQVPTISVPPKTTRVAIHLNLEPNDYTSYQVALIDQSSHQILWRSRNLKANWKNGTKDLDVSFSVKLLKPQAYTLQLSGIAATGKSEIMSDYPFKVVK